MGKSFDSPAFFRLIYLVSCASKLFKRIILWCLLFFLKSNFIFSSRQTRFRPGQSTLDRILYLAQTISHGFNKPRQGFRTILAAIDFSNAFDSVWHRALFQKLILDDLHPFFTCWTQSFLFNRRTWLVFKITKVVPFESVEIFCKDPFSGLYFSLFLSMIFLPLYLLPSAVLFTLTTRSFGPFPLWSPLRWKPHKEL